MDKKLLELLILSCEKEKSELSKGLIKFFKNLQGEAPKKFSYRQDLFDTKNAKKLLNKSSNWHTTEILMSETLPELVKEISEVFSQENMIERIELAGYRSLDKAGLLERAKYKSKINVDEIKKFSGIKTKVKAENKPDGISEKDWKLADDMGIRVRRAKK